MDKINALKLSSYKLFNSKIIEENDKKKSLFF